MSWAIGLFLLLIVFPPLIMWWIARCDAIGIAKAKLRQAEEAARFASAQSTETDRG